MEDKKDAFERLLHIMNDLRAQCPWDKKQTFASLRNLTIEETYELADAISKGDVPGIEEEIGDLLLHIVFYAKMGEETGAFDIKSAIDKLNAKLIHRHPHIYGDVVVKDEEEVKQNWERLKLKEGKKSVLAGVPSGLPAIIKAYRIQEKSGKVGFEWEHKSQVWQKVEEELAELKEAEQSGNQAHIAEEFGDVLFALINYARFIDVDPESALESINQKFIRRFNYIEEKAGESFDGMGLEAMDALWNEAKSIGL
ncbi:MAG: nucleoside triphosphate pyrophosphohydrolase [Saprospiraceae bacterium]|nr:nucleoside triphosphate pyrophosphohydrolase [Saprospiraceae bacterium]MBK8110158.1 nucleoside triphosphate pyrophosphohydrolase [Saprospiraceae bacterium]MBK8850687.1 nucleoside triphosphate pyrophosphohydrolase [Saprospiraceae bacterium]MBK9689853.1 nucleoside triphosphate pyrophosphohydrolase [Saprospiraceae bacterium]MBL0081119.1 nucleoside triphosphate pyrophosphohydrolase [Saprospiraceae bacterium]